MLKLKKFALTQSCVPSLPYFPPHLSACPLCRPLHIAASPEPPLYVYVCMLGDWPAVSNLKGGGRNLKKNWLKISHLVQNLPEMMDKRYHDVSEASVENEAESINSCKNILSFLHSVSIYSQQTEQLVWFASLFLCERINMCDLREGS